MNTLTNKLLLLLLLICTFALPACGSKEIKSQNNETTTLISTPTVAPIMQMSPTATATVSVALMPHHHPYTKKRMMVRHRILPHRIKAPMMAAHIFSPTPVPRIIAFSTTDETKPKKSGFHWPFILAILALLAALGFYFWTKRKPPHDDFPLPPMGGLSPVGGYTAMKNKIQKEAPKPSIWTKKIF